MKKGIVIFAVILINVSSFSQDFRKPLIEAMNAYKQNDYALFYDKIKEAHEFHPYHQGILYQFGIAAALTNRSDEAIQKLKQAILINADFDLFNPDVHSLNELDAFKKLLTLQKESQKLILNSDTSFVLKDRILHVEGIDYSISNQTFYLGSIHKRKIIQVTKDLKVSDFCSSGFEGMTSIFGVKVDEKRNLLWACSSPMEEMENYDTLSKSYVYKFEMSSGKLLKRYETPANIKNCIFGDLLLDEAGTVFISDSKNNLILTITGKSEKIERYLDSKEFWNIQGLALTPDSKFMFIADYIKGIFRLDLITKELKTIVNTLDVSLKGIDGVYFYHNSLIAIQNGVAPLRCSRYYLNQNLDAISDFKIIDRKHPAYNEPTLGVIVDNLFFYIANSQWGGYTNDHHINPESKLQDIVILKSSLK